MGSTGRRETEGVAQVSLGSRYLLAEHGGNQSLDTDTESRASKRRGTGSSLFGPSVQQRVCYLSEAGLWMGSLLHCNHWGATSSFLSHSAFQCWRWLKDHLLCECVCRGEDEGWSCYVRILQLKVIIDIVIFFGQKKVNRPVTAFRHCWDN